MTGINAAPHDPRFGLGTVMGAAGQVIDAVKPENSAHLLVGGCDGARPARNYYTEFVEKTPDDTIVLTLAAAMSASTDMNRGHRGGLPA